MKGRKLGPDGLISICIGSSIVITEWLNGCIAGCTRVVDDVERSGTVKTDQMKAAPRVLTDSRKRHSRTLTKVFNDQRLLRSTGAVIFFFPLNVAQDAFRC